MRSRLGTVAAVRRVKRLLYWRPFPPGTWQDAAFRCVAIAVGASIGAAIARADLRQWLGAMTGVAIVGIVWVTTSLRRANRTKSY
jgi:uncharacterized membrane protein YfcA